MAAALTIPLSHAKYVHTCESAALPGMVESFCVKDYRPLLEAPPPGCTLHLVIGTESSCWASDAGREEVRRRGEAAAARLAATASACMRWRPRACSHARSSLPQLACRSALHAAGAGPQAAGGRRARAAARGCRRRALDPHQPQGRRARCDGTCAAPGALRHGLRRCQQPPAFHRQLPCTFLTCQSALGLQWAPEHSSPGDAGAASVACVCVVYIYTSMFGVRAVADGLEAARAGASWVK